MKKMREKIKKILCICILPVLMAELSACAAQPEPILPETTVQQTTPRETTLPETTQPELAIPETTLPEHSDLYIPGVSVEDVITWFQEVALDTEFSYGGDATLIQKWMVPIYYSVEGNLTAEDMQVLESFVAWLNTIEGFPGIYPAEDADVANLQICFGDSRMIQNQLGDDYVNVDGGVRYWYEDNAIYDAIIGYRDDIPQHTRNSVILEEIYNGLGLVQDTSLREDSLIWQGFSEPQSLTAVDELLLKLIYHPDIKCGMNATECEIVIRSLYF